MGILGSIKKGFSLAVSSLPVVLVLFIFGFIFNLINLSFASKIQDPNAPPSLPMVLSGFVFIFVTVFLQGASMGYVRDKIKQGSATLSSFTAAGSKYYLKIFLLSLTIGLVIGVFVLLAALVLALLMKPAEYAAMGLAIVVAAIGIYTLILLFFAPYIAVSENKAVGACLKESVNVVRKNILKVIGISGILIAIGFLVGIVMGVTVGLASRVMSGGTSQYLFAFLSSLVNAFLGFFVTSSFMSFYLGLSSQPTVEATQQP